MLYKREIRGRLIYFKFSHPNFFPWDEIMLKVLSCLENNIYSWTCRDNIGYEIGTWETKK